MSLIVPVQINPMLMVITPFGGGSAFAWWADEQEIYWGVFQDDTGEPWWWENQYIRFKPSITDKHIHLSPIKLDPELEAKLASLRKKIDGTTEL